MNNILTLKTDYLNQVADLHISGIPTGFISSLGIDFVTVLYEAIAEDENSFGFVAFSTNLSKLYN